MLTKAVRDFSADLLDRKGILLKQTIYEKYDKAFDMLTLTQDELERKKDDMNNRLLKHEKT